MLNLFTHRINPSAGALASAQARAIHTLAQAPAGKMVTISGFGRLADQHRQHLQAYGLLPGRAVQVIAQRPVTIVLVEQTELAFETEIANQVFID